MRSTFFLNMKAHALGLKDHCHFIFVSFRGWSLSKDRFCPLVPLDIFFFLSKLLLVNSFSDRHHLRAAAAAAEEAAAEEAAAAAAVE